MRNQTKLWMRVLSLVLVVIMMGSMLLACKKKNEGAADTTSSDVVSSNDGPKSVLDGIRYNGETIYVYSWIPSNIVENVAEFSAELGVVEQAVYKRMDEVKKQLNINVTWKEEAGNGSHPEFVQQASDANLVGSYDVICCYSAFAATFTAGGVAKNLLQYPTMDFTHPTWPADMVNQTKLYNKLYFATGDISTNLIFMSSLVFVNLDMINTWQINAKVQSLYGVDDLYDLVRTGKWTYDAMFTLADGVYYDTDSSQGTKTDGDTYGFGTYSSLLMNFYAGAGYTLVEAGEQGLYISEDYFDLDKVTTLLNDTKYDIHDAPSTYYYKGGFAAARDAFAAGLNLFSLAPASHAYAKHYQTENLNYGALPVPKYTEAQEKYRSFHSHPYSNYLVASGSANPHIGASFIQCLAEWSYTTTRIAIYENTMKARYSQGDSDMSEMWEYIVGSQTFDLGRIFSTQVQHPSNKRANTALFETRLQQNNNDWSSIITKYKEELQSQIDDLNVLLAALPEE